ncbi:MAG: hypothetical protein E7160_00240 [Firmicutes bacterium]|nr:hypothetical protein [Bacillota bacterium]
MQKKNKIMIVLVVFIVAAIISYYLYTSMLYGYMMISGTIAALSFIVLVLTFAKKQDELSKYESNLKNMLKKFDSILAETSTFPDLEGKNIMLITNIEDMIDAAVEIRKPIYYKKDAEFCTFSLLDNNDICIYILKLNVDEETVVEKYIKNRKQNIENLIENAKDNRDIEDIVNSGKEKKKNKKNK